MVLRINIKLIRSISNYFLVYNKALKMVIYLTNLIQARFIAMQNTLKFLKIYLVAWILYVNK